MQWEKLIQNWESRNPAWRKEYKRDGGRVYGKWDEADGPVTRLQKKEQGKSVIQDMTSSQAPLTS